MSNRPARTDSPLGANGRPVTGFVVAVAVAVLLAAAIVALVIAAV